MGEIAPKQQDGPVLFQNVVSGRGHGLTAFWYIDQVLSFSAPSTCISKPSSHCQVNGELPSSAQRPEIALTRS